MRHFIRFMSQEELETYLKGEKLINETADHNGRIKGSFGFCFFDASEIDPITAQHILTGIATEEFMVEFMVKDEDVDKYLTKSHGQYMVPKNSKIAREKNFGPCMDNDDREICVLTEYCTKEYDRNHFVPYQIWHLVMSIPPFLASNEAAETMIGQTKKSCANNKHQ